MIIFLKTKQEVKPNTKPKQNTHLKSACLKELSNN